MRVNLPVGAVGDVSIRKVTAGFSQDIFRGRGTTPGEYTVLYRGEELWMSDTEPEWRDHTEAYYQMRRRGGRVLINGLGLGMIVKAALELDNVEHIDIVEIDADVIALVGPHYDDPRVTIHHGDAYTMTWPVGTRWSVAWHDIWVDMSEDNLPEMTKLHRSYGRRVDWQDSWGKTLILDRRRRMKNSWW